MTDLSAEELVRDAIQKLHRKIEALRPQEGVAMTDDPEITDPRDTYKRPDIVVELDRYLVRDETVGFTGMVQRARDEIVALRAMREAHIRRILSASLDDQAAIRDKALEEAARLCERVPGGDPQHGDFFAAAIRALKERGDD